MRPLEGDGGPGTESMTEEQRIILRDGISEQVMGWTSRRVSWAYAETAELWHNADDNPLMTRDSWRPDTNDSQVLEVLDRMVELGFRYTLGSVDETAYAEFHRAGDQSGAGGTHRTAHCPVAGPRSPRCGETAAPSTPTIRTDACPNQRHLTQRNCHPETFTAQALGHVDPVTGGLVASIHPATTYERDADGGYRSGRGYTRPHNPTYDEPEKLLSALEGGSDALLFASGMAAATAVFQSLLPGDHVVAPRVMYWSLRKWLVESAMSWGLDVEFLDTTDLERLRAAMRPGQTRLVWLETPANPTWEVTDIEGCRGDRAPRRPPAWRSTVRWLPRP